MSAFSLCFTTDSTEIFKESETTSKGTSLWVGCRDGSIFKLNGSIDFEYDISKISSIEFSTAHEMFHKKESENVKA